jgi:hypothetical protein
MKHTNVIEWNPVDSTKKVTLPAVWKKLDEKGFNPLLIERVRRFALSEQERGTLSKYQEFLEILGNSYVQAFNRSMFDQYNPTLTTLQKSMLDTIESLSNEFGDLIPATLWNTLASLIVRPNATKEDSILNVQEFLAHPWYVCDANLHALGVAYSLFFHVQSKFSKDTGHVIFHGCGCNHYIGGSEEVTIDFTMKADKKSVASKEFLDHLLGQTSLIVDKGYPFRLNDEIINSKNILSLRPTKTLQKEVVVTTTR